MPALEEIQHFEQEWKREEKHEKEFQKKVLDGQQKILDGQHRLESAVGVIKARIPEKAEATAKKTAATAKAAWRDLITRIVRVFLFSFIAAFIPLVSGLGAFPDMATAKAAAWAALVGAMAAVLKVVQASVTADEEPFLRTDSKD